MKLILAIGVLIGLLGSVPLLSDINDESLMTSIAVSSPISSILKPKTDLNIQPNTVWTPIGDSKIDIYSSTTGWNTIYATQDVPIDSPTYFYRWGSTQDPDNQIGCFLLHDSKASDRKIKKDTELSVERVEEKTKSYYDFYDRLTISNRWPLLTLKTSSGRSFGLLCYYLHGVSDRYYRRAVPTVGFLKKYFEFIPAPTEIIDEE